MSGRNRVLWAGICAAVVALGVALALVQHARRPRLPELVHYDKRPGPFNEALRGARLRIEAGPAYADDVRELAHLYQANLLPAEAEACYRVIAATPGGLSPRDHYYLAAIAEDASDLEKAQTELRATVKAEPSYVPARLHLADALVKSGRADDAAEEYAAVLAVEPNQPQASVGAARIELQRGNDKAAVGRLRDLIRHHPESTSGAALLSQVLDRQGDAEGAAAMRELSQQTHEPEPADPWMKTLLVECYDLQRLGIAFEQYRLTGQLGEALPLLERLEELDPDGWTAPMLRGWSEKEAHHYTEAVQDYRLALARGADPERICPLLGAALLSEGNPKGAAVLLADYHQRLPHSIPILLSYCETAVWLKDTKLARGLLLEALKAEPYLYMPNMSMVQILWTSGERDEAAGYLERVARVFPADVDSRGLLGQYYMDKSDPWSAIKPLEEAVAIARQANPRRDRLISMLDTAYLTAGSLEAAQGHFPKAAEFAQRSIDLFPGGLRGYALKANVCRRMDDFKGAEGALVRMGSLEPREPTIELSLGDVVYLEGGKEGARSHWRRALELAPAGGSGLREALRMRLAGQVSAEMLRAGSP